MRELKPESAIYKIEKVAGQGQTATVFRAIRQDSRGHSRQTVALKILKSRTAIPWLKREFEALAKVNSPYCVRVLGWENLPEGCALVLEWVEGITLLQLATRLHLSDAMNEEVIAQVHSGLRAIHDQGLHHGDLSPANILVDQSGRLRIVDFATAPFQEREIIGTPEYLAPEVWQGQPTSQKSDLFALGLIEVDLRARFENLPIGIEASRVRSTKLANSTSALLHPDPCLRRLRDIEPRFCRQVELGKAVKHLLENSPAPPVQTLVIRKPNTVVPLSFWLTTAAACLCLTAAPGQARAPLGSSSRQAAHLSIRTQNWMKITLNGKDLGYTPLQQVQALPGSHRLLWRSRNASGEFRFALKPGQELLLTESQLVQRRISADR